MKVPREVEIQDEIEKRLSSYDINPYSIICSFAFDSGIVSITFYLNSDLLEFLDILDYKNQCDKSGYLILEDNNTIILSGLGLINLYTLL